MYNVCQQNYRSKRLEKPLDKNGVLWVPIDFRGLFGLAQVIQAPAIGRISYINIRHTIFIKHLSWKWKGGLGKIIGIGFDGQVLLNPQLEIPSVKNLRDM